jgi:hypothetical protein
MNCVHVAQSQDFSKLETANLIGKKNPPYVNQLTVQEHTE